MIRRSFLWLSLAAVALAAPASAHPGHGGSEGLVHYLAEPVHVALTALLLLGGVGMARLVLRARREHRRIRIS
jgi:hydrogenase/urease accessory protein HupE